MDALPQTICLNPSIFVGNSGLFDSDSQRIFLNFRLLQSKILFNGRECSLMHNLLNKDCKSNIDLLQSKSKI